MHQQHVNLKNHSFQDFQVLFRSGLTLEFLDIQTYMPVRFLIISEDVDCKLFGLVLITLPASELLLEEV